jgi:hypothetical protein
MLTVEPVIGPATSGRTRWLYPSYALCNSDAAVQPRKDSHGIEGLD